MHSPVHHALDAFLDDGLRQRVEVGLEGIFDVGASEVDVCPPQMPVQVPLQQILIQRPDVVVPREQDVGGVVEHVPSDVDALAQPADPAVLFEDHVSAVHVVRRA
jgi:hypothetical protein